VDELPPEQAEGNRSDRSIGQSGVAQIGASAARLRKDGVSKPPTWAFSADTDSRPRRRDASVALGFQPLHDRTGALMSRSAAPEEASAPTGDPFVRQMNWLIDTLGGKDQLVRASDKRVSVRTLDNWVRGSYPRLTVTGAVRDLDAWAAANVPGYPGAGAPRLIECCGPGREPFPVPPAAEPADQASEPPASSPAAAAVPTPPSTPTRRPWLRHSLALIAAAAVVVGTTVAVTLTVVEDDDETPMLGVLPSSGDGQLYTEKTGSLGANTFSDPRALTDRALPIPADTEIQVRCRYYAPVIPSVVPDGFWYLIDSGKWAGRWAPANSFMNGDVPGQPTLHNTDFAVPVCE
jgi:pyruvate/2-oxoglutarate dehydrogenase complex dihydrolipoamide acyltransferase (E2) component